DSRRRNRIHHTILAKHNCQEARTHRAPWVKALRRGERVSRRNWVPWSRSPKSEVSITVASDGPLEEAFLAVDSQLLSIGIESPCSTKKSRTNLELLSLASGSTWAIELKSTSHPQPLFTTRRFSGLVLLDFLRRTWKSVPLFGTEQRALHYLATALGT